MIVSGSESHIGEWREIYPKYWGARQLTIRLGYDSERNIQLRKPDRMGGQSYSKWAKLKENNEFML